MFDTAPIGEISIYYVILIGLFFWLAHKLDQLKK